MAFPCLLKILFLLRYSKDPKSTDLTKMGDQSSSLALYQAIIDTERQVAWDTFEAKEDQTLNMPCDSPIGGGRTGSVVLLPRDRHPLLLILGRDESS